MKTIEELEQMLYKFTNTSEKEWASFPSLAQLMELVEAEKAKGEVVITRNPRGEIVTVTRQDKEGHILSIIAQADSRRGTCDMESIRDKWKIVDGDCREGANGLLTYHVDAFDEGVRIGRVRLSDD